MAREDQMEAVYELFGGTAGTQHVTSSSVLPFLVWLSKGDPLVKLQNQTPMFYINIPRSSEARYAQQIKIVTYTVSCTLIWATPGVNAQGADRGASVMNQFYGWLDQIASVIRGNKQLVTTSYPLGASIRFGEDFKITEAHTQNEALISIVAQFDIESEEQVIA